MTLIILFAAYLIGSIPFGLLLTRAAGLGDIRAIGSGNIGATNVMRTGNKKLGIATLLLDAGKGLLAVYLARKMGLPTEWCYAAGFAAILGHIFPLWLKFKGGKGVATALGALMALNPILAGLFAFNWLAGAAMTRYVSLASMLALWILPIVPFCNDNPPELLFTFALALLVTWTHRGNIKRLRAGTEPTFGRKP